VWGSRISRRLRLGGRGFDRLHFGDVILGQQLVDAALGPASKVQTTAKH
jgi:hypothetical protein